MEVGLIMSKHSTVFILLWYTVFYSDSNAVFEIFILRVCTTHNQNIKNKYLITECSYPVYHIDMNDRAN